MWSPKDLGTVTTEMFDFFSSPWIPLVLLIGIAGIARIIRGSWLHPSAFPALVWSVFILAALIAAPEYGAAGLGVWLIVALTVAAHLGASVVGRQAAPSQTKAAIRPNRWIRWVAAFASLALTGAVIFAITALSENGLPASLSGLLALGHVLSVARYSGIQEPAIVRALWTWVFPGAVLGGVAYVFARNHLERALSLSAFVPALLFSFLETTRGGFIIAMCCWLGAYLSTKVYSTGGRYRLFNRHTLIVIVALTVVVCSVFVVFDAIRLFTPDRDFSVEPNYARVKAYFFGSLGFFKYWVDHDQNSTGLTFGTETFRSFFELVGLRTWQINPILRLEGGGETNIPTAFRGLIQDFTFPGALLICLAWGYASGRAFEKTKQGDMSSICLLAAYYSLFLFSPIIALTAYNGPIFAWIVVGFLLRSTSKTQFTRGFQFNHAST
jgi:oligosaccharide repeat unit polymerase